MTAALCAAWMVLGVRGLQATQDPTSLSVDEAVRIGVERSLTIAQAESSVRKTLAQIDQAKAGLGPKFGVGANYTRYDKATSSQFGGGSIDSKTANAQVSILIDLSGVVGLGIRAARIYTDAARAQVAVARNQVKNDIRAAFYNVVRLQTLLVADEAARANAVRRLQIGQAQFNVGQVAKFDVIRLQTEVTRLEAAVVQDRNAILASKQQLNVTMSRPPQTPVDVIDPGTPAIAAPEDPDALAQTSQKARPEVQAADLQIEALGTVVQAERRGLAPTLSVSAGVNHNFDPSQFQRSTSGQLSASINWPIFDSGLTRARVRAAEEDQMRAKLQREQLVLNVSLQVRQAALRVVNAQEQVRLGRQQVEQAREALRIADLLFEQGRGILLDTTTAQENLTRAETSLANANFEYLSAVAALQYAVGQDDLPGMGKGAPTGEGNQ